MRTMTAVLTILAGLSLALLVPGAFAASVGSLPIDPHIGDVFGLGGGVRASCWVGNMNRA